ncbi:Cinnamoyl-CoA reductase 2 [Sesamum angolense]|uniref:Cinnamoyl-CoA reductase 2 n=1 Tax=Sesamum angolense TaxID=2727404 RepID=A0AAE2BY47_9LAMI|nr:Cinnamoyl-CoA reductase 2 [Sesamum angolense]
MADQPRNAANKPPVCVTGANGFIGSWLVKTLLEHGYTTIHLSIFPGSDPSHLFSLPGATSPTVSLIVHHVNLLDAAAVDKAVEGAQGGTLNVLAAAKKFGVRRVVLTSSISAMVPNPGWPTGKVFDESSWTDLDYCKSRQKWYPVSKILAEKAAWEFAKENNVDVVAINPATCLGQLLQSGLNASCAVLQQLLQGSKDTQEYHWLGAVHVKDVATAQLLLFETPTALGRYLCTNGIYQFGDFAEKISKLFPEFPIHRFVGETQPGLVACEDAAKRLIDLGLKFTPVEDAVRDTVFSLKAKGFLGQEKPSS